MNSMDILLYTIGITAVLYVLWITMNLIWLGIIRIYHVIDDYLYIKSFNRYHSRFEDWAEKW